jgi:hypothetical protein
MHGEHAFGCSAALRRRVASHPKRRVYRPGPPHRAQARAPAFSPTPCHPSHTPCLPCAPRAVWWSRGRPRGCQRPERRSLPRQPAGPPGRTKGTQPPRAAASDGPRSPPPPAPCPPLGTGTAGEGWVAAHGPAAARQTPVGTGQGLESPWATPRPNLPWYPSSDPTILSLRWEVASGPKWVAKRLSCAPFAPGVPTAPNPKSVVGVVWPRRVCVVSPGGHPLGTAPENVFLTTFRVLVIF